MADLVVLAVVLAALTRFQGLEARRANVSNAWYLPDKKSPVFYRYFGDKVTWNEAEAVCSHHHADLLSVQTSARMDSARAYLKDLDVADGVWIGLQRESAEKPFVSIRDANQNVNVENILISNAEKVPDDGYWLQPIPKTNEKLCVALDPYSDYRWNAYYCEGPQVFSFVCELPVPDWARKEDGGCVVTSLPSLTITFIPEINIVQLFSDCGLNGTRRIACKSGMKQKDMVKILSCDNYSKDTRQQSPKSLYQTGKARALHQPQTRHKRSADLQSGHQSGTSKEPDTFQTESTTQVTSTSKSKEDSLNVSFHNFPHSPAEKNILTNKSLAKSPEEKSIKSPVSPEEKTEKAFDILTKSLNLTNKNKTEKNEANVSMEVPTEIPKSTERVNVSGGFTRTPIHTTDNKVPVLITAQNTLNESESYISTSPQTTFKLPEEKNEENNNPSPPSMNLDDMDVIGGTNVTGTTQSTPKSSPSTTTISSQTTHHKSLVGLHPLRLGEKSAIAEVAAATTATTSTTATTATSAATTFMPVTKPVTMDADEVTVIPNVQPVKQTVQQNVMENNNEEELDVRQRPLRGRVLSRSNIPSFYPYFLNKVLG